MASFNWNQVTCCFSGCFPGDSEPLSAGPGVRFLQQRGEVRHQVHRNPRPGDKLQDRCVSTAHGVFSSIITCYKRQKVNCGYFCFAGADQLMIKLFTQKYKLLLLLTLSCYSVWCCFTVCYSDLYSVFVFMFYNGLQFKQAVSYIFLFVRTIERVSLKCKTVYVQ